MRSTFLIIAALAASVVAVPAPADKKTSTTTSVKSTTSTTSSKTSSSTSSAPTCKNPTAQNANFDDVTAVPGTTGNTIPVPYKGLYFQGFSVSSTINTGLGQPGVFPHSPANYAASSARTTINTGSAEFTTVYPNSNVKSYDLYSLYYGCVLSAANGAAAVPTPCNIAVTGYATGDNTASTVQVAAQEFSYNPSTMTGSQQQTMVTFSSAFKNLQYVLVQYTLPGGTAAASADLTILFDDIMYRTCST